MTKERQIWFKGKIIPVSEAKINVLAPTCQFGANVFEGMQCYWNEEEKQLYGFRISEHMLRLIDSVTKIGFKNKYNIEELVKYFKDIIKANNYKEDIAVRQTIFLDGFGSWSSKEPTEMFIAPIARGRPFNKDKIGISCFVSSWERINEKSLSPKIKCGANYINSRMAQLEAVKKGYDTAILLNNKGTVSEAPGSCIVIIKNNKLITPPLTASILNSITRLTVLEIAKKELNLETLEQDIQKEELETADEIFLCGTSMEITPVIMINKTKINNENIGEITKKIRRIYFDIVRNKVKKYSHWLMPIYKTE